MLDYDYDAMHDMLDAEQKAKQFYDAQHWFEDVLKHVYITGDIKSLESALEECACYLDIDYKDYATLRPSLHETFKSISRQVCYEMGYDAGYKKAGGK